MNKPRAKAPSTPRAKRAFRVKRAVDLAEAEELRRSGAEAARTVARLLKQDHERTGAGGDVATATQFDGMPVKRGPGGMPLGYVPIQNAYALVSVLPLTDVKRVAKGNKPESPIWGNRPVVAQYSRAAAEYLSAMPRGTPKEINDRTDGPVAQVVQTMGLSFVVEVPAPAQDAETWESEVTRDLALGDGSDT